MLSQYKLTLPQHSMAQVWNMLMCCCILQILQLTSLRSLDLSNTCLSSLPLGITALKALQELQLGACSFRCVPAQLLRQLDSLRDLDLSRNADLELQQLSMDDLTWLATGALMLGCESRSGQTPFLVGPLFSPPALRRLH